MNTELTQEMATSWDDKAVTNAYHWVDSTKESWEKDAYYTRGEEEAKAHILEPLLRHGVTPQALASMRVLDIGCGTGRLVRFFATKAREVIGVDISEEMIETAKKDNGNIQNATFLVGNGTDLSVCEDGSFDIVYSFIVFQHIPSRTVITSYINEMFRVLQKGGRVRFQVRGYPGNLRMLPVWRSVGFDRWYIALDALKGIIPFPVIRRYNTVYGAFFKKAEIQRIVTQAGFTHIAVEQDSENQRYLWITAQK